MSDANEPVLYDLEGGVATITINRPAQLNAIDVAARAALFAAWRRFEHDPEARVAILTGAGDRAFCVGRDLKESAEGNFRLESFPILGLSVEVTKPVIAAVNGYALGGGFLFAQMCDLCIASETATFSIPEAKLGRGAAWAAPLVRMLPMRIAMELLVTAGPMAATRLRDAGLVNEVIPQADLMPSARRMAAAIAANAPLAVAACKRMVRKVASEGALPSVDEAESMFRHVYESNDAKEGIAAFRERRPARWTGT